MDKKFLRRLDSIVAEQYYAVNEPMRKHTTFRIGGNADVFVLAHIGEIERLLALAKEYDMPVTIVGNGSNLLVADKGIRGMVICIAKNAEYMVTDGRRIKAGGGTLLSRVASEALRWGLKGIAFASGIPGTVGGAVAMNAGAYGGEMKDIVQSVQVMTMDGETLTLEREDLEFGYRTSSIMEKGYIVIEVTLELDFGNAMRIREDMDDYRNRRIEKQPLDYPSAGSTFKRPEGHFAGKLIEDAGLRGLTVGGAQVSEKHCGFIINTGMATAEDVRILIEEVRTKVYEAFQVELEPEVKMIGEFE